MGEGFGFEGFVSCRGKSELLAGQLVKRLEELGIVCAWHTTADERSQEDHKETTANLIHSTSFFVVLIDPDFYGRSTDGAANYQFTEIMNALSMTSSDTRERVASGGGANYVVFPILLSPDAESQESQYLKEVRQIATTAESELERGVYGRLAKIPARHSIFEYDQPESELRSLSLDAVVGAIHQRVLKLRADRAASLARETAREMQEKMQRLQEEKRQSKIPAKMFAEVGAQNVAEEAAKKPATDPMQALIEAYVEKAAGIWGRGLIPAGPQVKEARRAQEENEFAFNSARFMELDGEEAFTTQGGGGGVQPREPMSSWLLSKQPGIVYLLGEAGAGKTTVAAAAALAYASHWRPKHKVFLRKFADGAWQDAAERHLSEGPKFLPISVSIPRLAVHLPDPENTSGDELYTAIVDCMREVTGTTRSEFQEVTGADFGRYLERQNVALFLDGLDEVSRSIAIGISNAATGIYWQFQDDERDQFRLIITSRPGVHERSKDDVHIRLLGPDWPKIQEFIWRYIEEQNDQERSQEKHALLLEKANSLLSSNDESESRLVQRPMLLKLFCWHFWKNGAFIRQIDFCEIVISYLTTDRQFDAIQSRLADKSANGEDAARVARKILSWLALRAFQKKVDKKTSGETSLNATETELQRRHAEFGLSPLKAGCAGRIIKNLAAETNLLAITSQNISFREHMLFCEYLVSEAISDRDPEEMVKSIGAEQIANWTNPLTFAEHSARLHGEEAGEGGSSLPYSNALLLHAQRMAAQGHDEDARRLLEVAIKVLAENQDPETSDVPQEVKLAVEVYRSISGKLSTKVRDGMIHGLVRLGARDNAGAQRRAVQKIFDDLLHQRRHWVEVKAPGLPAGYRLADAPVHVTAFRLFCEAEDCMDPDFWGHLPGGYMEPEFWGHPPGADDFEPVFTTALGTPDCDTKGRAIWAAQVRKPGAPLVGVNWFEAVAYCQWLTRRLQQEGSVAEDEVIRLPTVSEWMTVAAVCANGRKYVFGNEFSDAAANTGLLKLDGASPAGVFPPSGPGLYDFGSNVRCWTVNDAAEEGASWPPAALRFREGLLNTDDKPRVAGGSWVCTQEGFFDPKVKPRTLDPFSRSRMVGFRLVRAKTETG